MIILSFLKCLANLTSWASQIIDYLSKKMNIVECIVDYLLLRPKKRAQVQDRLKRKKSQKEIPWGLPDRIFPERLSWSPFLSVLPKASPSYPPGASPRKPLLGTFERPSHKPLPSTRMCQIHLRCFYLEIWNKLFERHRFFSICQL